MKKFKLFSFLVMVAMLMALTSCVCTNRIVTTPIVPEITIMEKEVVLPAPAPTVTKIREPIMFDYDSSVISSLEMVKVNKVEKLMKEYPDTMVALIGYASSEGGFVYNMDLALARAEAVENALMLKGIESDRIHVNAKGETDIFGELLDLNRRVLVLDVGK